MAKVYGICGDSKCRREVYPKDEVYSKGEVYSKSEVYSKNEVYSKDETYSRNKVYSKSEVYSRDNFKLVTGSVSIPKGAFTHNGDVIPFPSGFTNSNCIAIGVQLNDMYGNGSSYIVFYDGGFRINLSSNSTYGTTISYRVLLMKV